MIVLVVVVVVVVPVPVMFVVDEFIIYLNLFVSELDEADRRLRGSDRSEACRTIVATLLVLPRSSSVVDLSSGGVCGRKLLLLLCSPNSERKAEPKGEARWRAATCCCCSFAGPGLSLYVALLLVVLIVMRDSREPLQSLRRLMVSVSLEFASCTMSSCRGKYFKVYRRLCASLSLLDDSSSSGLSLVVVEHLASVCVESGAFVSMSLLLLFELLVVVESE